MHFNFDFSARQTLWALEFATQLVLLIVLMGRDRIRRFPWFTAAIALTALRLMAEVLLAGRLATIPYQTTMLALADLGAVIGLLVLVEVARRAFAGAPRNMWIANTVGLLAVAVGVVAAWGPWPRFKEMGLDTLLGKLRLMQLVALKGDTFVALLTIGVGVLIVFFGRRFKAGWRSHPQHIIIGLSTLAVSLLTIQTAVQSIIRTAHPTSVAERDRIIALLGNLMNANKLVDAIVVLWWIVWLWPDEPGAHDTPIAETPAQAETAAE